MNPSINNINKINYKRIFIFILIIIQSIGIRYFQGQGYLISLIIIGLSLNSIKLFTPRTLTQIIFIFILSLIPSAINLTFDLSIHVLLMIIAGYLFIHQYKKNIFLLRYEFYLALKILTVHALIGYALFLILPSLFNTSIGLNKSFNYLFYISSGGFSILPRNTGVLWEPGVFQLVANLYLFFCIKFKKKLVTILIAGLAVVSSFSTIGLMILLINFIYYFNQNPLKSSLKKILVVLTAMIFFIPLLIENAENKIFSGNNSGLIRQRDFNIGLTMIKEKPIFGHGIFKSDDIKNLNYVSKIESYYLNENFIKETGEMAGGFTNGLLWFIAAFGLPISMLFFVFAFKNNFVDKQVKERILFFGIIILTMFSEPMSLTLLVFLFPFSYLIFKKSKVRKIMVKNEKELNKINYTTS